ncbi:MAG TPA: hypothetical protein VMV93_03245 [Chloroflexota bacterium]|nr:hypothetical protein [Chloroflexota bacterium]
MAEAGPEWAPSGDELAYWQFLRLSGRPCVAWLCMSEGKTSMWARPRDPLMRHAFITKHAGHEHLYVGEILDRHAEAAR